MGFLCGYALAWQAAALVKHSQRVITRGQSCTRTICFLVRVLLLLLRLQDRCARAVPAVVQP
jgi:hypothetical protein